MIDRFEKFSLAISELYRYWHRIAADVMEHHGLKGPYAIYFTTMYRHPDGITSAKLAELCSRDKADVSRAIATLEKNGLIERDGANNNYRAPLKLTDEGEKIAEMINEKAAAAVEYGGHGLSDKDRETFYAALELITSNLQKLTEKGL